MTSWATYQRDLDRAITKRLHGYLPLTSLGVPVDFTFGAKGDVRLAGLTGLLPGDARLSEMRTTLRGLIATVFQGVLSGADEDKVYALWRDVTRDAVAEARSRFEAPIVVPPTTTDVAAAVATSLAGAQRFGPHDTVDPDTVTDVMLCFDQNLTTRRPSCSSRSSRTQPVPCGSPSSVGVWATTTSPGSPQPSRPSR